MFAVSEATVPKIHFITRKLYGGAYGVMSPKEFNGDFNYAWPTAEVAVMGAKGAVEILFRGKNPEHNIKKYEEAFANPLVASKNGIIDDIVMPDMTRALIADNLRTLDHKDLELMPRTHDNCPL
mmetsp:Transcript_602/g.647  ORF Transcript_602/g.647 Transcript_602/m.647 type:complete len:124 (+) Transcript_602:493-864(+)